MGRILKYVVILSNLSLIFGVQIYEKPSQGRNYEREKHGNFTPSFKQPLGESEKLLPLGFQGRRRALTVRPGQMKKSLGLQAFASENTEWKVYKRNFSDQRFWSQQKRAPSFSQSLYPRSNSKKTFSGDYPGKVLTSQKLSRLLNQNHSVNQQNNKTEDNRRHYHGRNGRTHQRLAKICDPCNSVPWVPLLKVPDSYRQHRTHISELHPTPQQNFNFDYHSYASNTQNVLLPPVPLVSTLEPIYDGTISSSFGLPIGNIPTSHGLLAPINHLAPKVNKYGGDNLDYSNSFGYFPTQDLLESNPFPELSPVPIVPIHDSGQFYRIDSTIPDLVPPPNKPVDVSNVVLTIAENSPAKQSAGKPNRDLSSSVGYHNSQSTVLHKVTSQSTDYGKLEIVKSVPLAEFTSTNDYSVPQSNLPLYPPLQSEPPNKYHNHKEEPVDQNSANDQSSYNILVPPKKSTQDENPNQSIPSSVWNDRPKEPEEASTAPKPLTSPSLSWLFSDHTASPDLKSTSSISSVSSFATEAKELASVVNSELQPVSPQPLPVSSTTSDASKSKKIQIIIPYTTKSKNGYDNNALESVQHEIFQPLVSESTFENNLSRDLASSTHTFLPNLVPQTKTNRGTVIDGSEIDKSENKPTSDDAGKYLSEMHHIIASNIRQLLRQEIEKSQNDQNYPLQNNIDNWTALEYSNHKTVETKAPKEIITQALAVTSIPGTSISHLLLPSKKIPNEYFVTTPTPVYDEPSAAVYNATNTTVNSRPFTAKPYATTNVYLPTSTFRENKPKKENSHRDNHEKNYTEVERGRVNNWGRLNENLVLPEPRSKKRIVSPTTVTVPPTAQASAWTSRIYASHKNEKVQIVTPVSVTSNRTQSTTFRRTTRHVYSSESPTTVTPAVTRTVNVTQKPLFLRKLNSTKLERISNLTLPLSRKFSVGDLTTRATTKATVTTAAPKSDVENSTRSVLVLERTKQLVSVKESDVKTHTTGSPNMSNVNFSKTQQISINDIFPFRNKELPWESSSNSSQHNFRVDRQRKSLIKQTNLVKPKAADVSS